MAQIRLKVPPKAKTGEIIELKAMIGHTMESGYRRDNRGEAIPRHILTKFECIYNDDIIFTADFGPGVAANPIVTFYTRATNSGTLKFRWTDQDGTIFEDGADITVT